MISRLPRTLPALLLCAPMLAGLSACGTGGDLERSFGLTRDPPDEFTVTTRAPLSMPPDFTLRPPQPGAQRPQELTPQQAAEAALAPDTALTAGGPQAASGPDTTGQDALVQQAGPAAPADIRKRVDSEASLDQPGHGFADQLMFWKADTPSGTVIDASKESERLRENAALGQPPTVGDTPTQQPKKTGSFLGLF